VSGCTCDHNPHKASCPSYGEDYLAHPDTPVRVDWWWTAEGRAAHDAAIRAEAWDEALRWVRQQADVTSPEYVLERIDRAEPFNPYRAAQPTEGES
jgi:hypothetical protein